MSTAFVAKNVIQLDEDWMAEQHAFRVHCGCPRCTNVFTAIENVMACFEVRE